MAQDFRADQVVSNKLIASGGINDTSVGLVVYSGSQSTDATGGIPSSMLSGVGTDVYFFVSGAVDGKSKTTDGSNDVVLFGGDVVISGTMYAEKIIAEVDELTTGSLSVSGSLFVSQSATIGHGIVVNDKQGSSAIDDAQIKSSNKTHAFFVDASKDQVLILSGGGGTDPDEAAATDLAFFVSGAINGKDATSAANSGGVALFGGDVVVSGTLYPGSSVSITDDLTVGDDLTVTGNTYLSGTAQVAGMLKVSGSYTPGPWASSVALEVSDGNADFLRDLYVAHDTRLSGSVYLGKATLSGFHSTGSITVASDSAFTADLSVGDDLTVTGNTYISGTLYPENLIVTSDLVISDDLTVVGNTYLSGSTFTSGSVIVNYERAEGNDFKIYGTNKQYIMVTDGDRGQGQVFFLSGGAGSDPNEGNYKDLAFFVSGAIGGKGATAGNKAYGTSIFGGDVAVSGGLYLDERVEPGAIADGTVVLYGKDDSGVTKLYFKNESGEVEVGSGGGGGGGGDGVGWTSPSAGHLNATGSVVLAGGQLGSAFVNTNIGSDVFFFVSGTIDAKDTSVTGSTVFGGDVIISGSLFPGLDISQNLGSSTNRWANIYTGDLHLKNDRGNWTILEEADYLCVVNNLTGKRYKMVLEPID